MRIKIQFLNVAGGLFMNHLKQLLSVVLISTTLVTGVQAAEKQPEKQGIATSLLKAGLCGLAVSKVTFPWLMHNIDLTYKASRVLESCIKYNTPGFLNSFDLGLSHNIAVDCYNVAAVNSGAAVISIVLGALCIKLGYETVKNLIKAAQRIDDKE